MATAPYAGGNTQRPIDLYLTDESGVAVGITATPSGTQSTAFQLTKAINSVDTVATAADAVKLPLAIAGARVTVCNTTATSAQVFGAGTDTIDGVATATGKALAGGKTSVYTCVASAPAGKWRSCIGA